MRGSEEDIPPLEPFLTFTFLIDREQSYEFMLRCGVKTTVGDVLGVLQKNYDAGVKGRKIFRDRECSLEVRAEDRVQKKEKYYLNLAYAEYEAIVKSLFSAKTAANKPKKEKSTIERRQQKIEVGNMSTNEGKVQENSSYIQVSKFDMPDTLPNPNESMHKPAGLQQVKVSKRPRLQPQPFQSQPQELETSIKPFVSSQIPQKVHPQKFENSKNFIQTTDSIQRGPKPQAVTNGDCCLLI